MNENYRITKDSISIVGGICFILLALVTFISNDTPFVFLSDIICDTFGFVGFWILLPFILVLGIYLIAKRKLIKLKLGLALWGIFIIILSLVVLSSNWASIGESYNSIEITGIGRTEIGAPRYLIFSNAVSVFGDVKAKSMSAIGPTTKLGGGIIGYILAGAINSAITPIGLNIICWFMLLGGLYMIFNTQIINFVNKIRRNRGIQREKDVVYKSVNLTDGETNNDEPIVEPISIEPVIQKQDNRPIFESFHTSAPINNDSTLRKAYFELPEEENSSNDKENLFVKETKKAVFEEYKEPVTNEPKVAPIGENLAKTPEFAPEIEVENTPIEESFEAPQQEEQKPVEVDFVNRPQPKAKFIENYVYPNLDLLDYDPTLTDTSVNNASCDERVKAINQALVDLRIGAEVTGYTVGPSVTRYDLKMNPDVSITAFPKYVTDISIRLNGLAIRFEPIVAGKSTSGLEIENSVRTNVYLREAISQLPVGEKYLLNIPFGKTITGELKYADMADFPHMLVAGTTGSGKSICIHSTIISLIMRNKPEQLKLLLIDPKKVEMNYYADIPHLICPVISDAKKVYLALMKLVDEMERRYNLFSENKVRDIRGFNYYAKEHDIQPLPYIVVFVDEYADLIETCKEIRDPVVKIVQKSRAAGIHMVIATQRPSVNVIDGVIKGNLSTRIALMCASATDSMTVIGEGGAETLLGHGDMLVECSLISRSMKPRVQGCYISELEIDRVCDFLRNHYKPEYDPEFMNLEPKPEVKNNFEPEIKEIDKTRTEDEQYQSIKEQIMCREYCSISFIQRSFGMGFSRAGKIFNQLQREGIVASSGDARGCKVLCYVPSEQQMGSVEQSTYIPDDQNS